MPLNGDAHHLPGSIKTIEWALWHRRINEHGTTKWNRLEAAALVHESSLFKEETAERMQWRVISVEAVVRPTASRLPPHGA